MRVSRHVENAERRTAPARLVGELRSLQSRHHDVGEEQLDLADVGVEHLEGARTILGEQHLMAVAGENTAHDVTDRVIVLGDQDRLAAAVDGRRLGLVVGANCRRGRGEQRTEGRPDAWRRVERRLPAGLGDDAVHGREAEPGALALGLGAEERFERVLLRVQLHALARVADTYPYMPAGLQTRMGARVCGVGIDIPRLDRERSAEGHCIARVHGKVHEDLFDTTGIGDDRPEIGLEIGDELDMLADRVSQQLLGLGDDGVEADHARLHDFAASERKELVRQSRGALRGSRHLLDVALHGDPPLTPGLRCCTPELLVHERGIVDDRGEQVVEVMGDSAGELTEALEALDVLELALAAFLLGVGSRISPRDGHVFSLVECHRMQRFVHAQSL